MEEKINELIQIESIDLGSKSSLRLLDRLIQTQREEKSEEKSPLKSSPEKWIQFTLNLFNFPSVNLVDSLLRSSSIVSHSDVVFFAIKQGKEEENNEEKDMRVSSEALLSGLNPMPESNSSFEFIETSMITFS
eukprot:TRINITY_DN13230_c0_g1_i1.p1 TRINITY_DN13230_c0_g1~~TRINITY_DN13230_c0_g1_i1.p1  ORF type:complete len:133 (+),score=48.76 TRINITY_DN13230_c0_g1_i1:55-453(+)